LLIIENNQLTHPLLQGKGKNSVDRKCKNSKNGFSNRNNKKVGTVVGSGV